MKGRSPEKITTADVQSFLLYLYRRKVSSNTITKYRNTLYTLNTLYATTVFAGLTKHNPLQRVTEMKRYLKSLQFFYDKQIEKFKQAKLHPQLWLAIQFLYYCFIRPVEMRLLKISAVNLEYNFIEIPQFLNNKYFTVTHAHINIVPHNHILQFPCQKNYFADILKYCL